MKLTLKENPTVEECRKYVYVMNALESCSAFEWSEVGRACDIIKSFRLKPSYNPLFDEPVRNYHEDEIPLNPLNQKAFLNHRPTKTNNPRKSMPIFTGVLKYFPNALLEVSKVSLAGNKQHKNGEELKWDKSKSPDEADALVRHLLQAGEIDDDGIRHTSKVAWRALALLERELERENKRNI